MTNIVSQLSENLRVLAVLHGQSLNELALKTGVPQSTLHNISVGISLSPHAKTLRSLSNFFNISINQLMGKEKLPLLITEAVRINLGVHAISILSWDEAKIWPNIPGRMEKSYQQIMIDQRFNPESFVLLSHEAPCDVSSFPEKTELVLDPARKPADRDFALIISQETNVLSFSQLLAEKGGLYIKETLPNDDIRLKKLNLNQDRIIAILIESRSFYH